MNEHPQLLESTYSYWYWRTFERLNFLLVIRSHPFIGIYFVNKKTNIMSFVMVSAENLFYENVFWAPTLGMMQSMNGSGCWHNLLCLENSMTKTCNLMILNNSGRDYARMLLFVYGFLVCWKFASKLSRHFYSWSQSGYINVVKKIKCDVRENQSLRFYFDK